MDQGHVLDDALEAELMTKMELRPPPTSQGVDSRRGQDGRPSSRACDLVRGEELRSPEEVRHREC